MRVPRVRSSMALVVHHPTDPRTAVLSYRSEFKVIDRASSVVSTHRTSSDIVAACFSHSGNLFAVCNSDKQLQLFDATNQWSCRTRAFPKRATAVKFSLDDKYIYIADKAGDVHRYIVDGSDSGQLLLGHVSMLLDMVLAPEDRFIITADRDEKIRVSCLPNAYNIFCYCLGHQDFVSQVKIHPKANRLLLSGSGDGCIGLWCYETGSCFQLLPLPRGEDDKPAYVSCISCCTMTGLIAVAGLPLGLLWFFKLADSGCHLEFLAMTHLAAPPLDIAFDANQTLWVLVASNISPLLMINGQHVLERKEIQFVTRQSYFGDCNVSLEGWDFSKGFDFCIDYSTLKKTAYDNTVDYRERKQKRLEGKGKDGCQNEAEAM